MKRCPFCAEEIQDAAVVCKHCGRDLQSTATLSASPPKAKRSRIIRWGGGLLLAMLALGIVASVLNPSPPEQKNSPRNAYLVCWQFVRKALASPSTAKFPVSSDPDVVSERQADGAYLVTAYVDSQNRFGAMIRTPFTCKVTWDQGDAWNLNDLKLAER